MFFLNFSGGETAKARTPAPPPDSSAADRPHRRSPPAAATGPARPPRCSGKYDQEPPKPPKGAEQGGQKHAEGSEQQHIAPQVGESVHAPFARQRQLPCDRTQRDQFQMPLGVFPEGCRLRRLQPREQHQPEDQCGIESEYGPQQRPAPVRDGVRGG